MISILILEDNPVLGQRFRDILAGWDFTSKVQLCASNAEARKIITTETIDLLLADLNVDDGDGTDTISLLTSVNSEALTIVISGISQPNRIIDAIKKGAVGYLHKNDSSMQLIGSIEKALKGQSPISAEIAIVLCKALHEKPESQATPSNPGLLTPREVEVIDLVSRGLSYSEIADVLSISVNTLPVHIRNIYRKLQTNNRSEAVFEARRIGILQ